MEKLSDKADYFYVSGNSEASEHSNLLNNLTTLNNESDNYFNLSCSNCNQEDVINQFSDYINIENNLEYPNKIYGFNELLNNQRNQIDKINSDVWKKIRWYINQYDFLVKDPIINRAFYKYWEIINRFNIFEHFDPEKDIIFHCAEAPGGFVQGSNVFLGLDGSNRNNKSKTRVKKVSIIDDDGFTTVCSQKPEKIKYKIFTISLNKNLPQYKFYNLPSYNDNVINKYVYITYGKDHTGDINNLQNINYVKEIANKYSNSSDFYLITADGGFDEGTDFNNKEQLHYFLILNEIYTAMTLQKEGGSFILKVFDIFTDTSIHLLYLLNILYEEVYIYKPLTSRPTNSEKYVICKKFRKFDLNTYSSMKKKIHNLSENIKKRNLKYCTFKLFKTIPDEFIENIKNMNMELLNKQCFFLDKAILYCNDTEFIKNYENELFNSIEKRKEVFHEWISTYNLNKYITKI